MVSFIYLIFWSERGDTDAVSIFAPCSFPGTARSGRLNDRSNASLSANSGYDRNAAATYALTYARNYNTDHKYFTDDNGDGVDCTNFVSQCLLAGDMPEIPKTPLLQ